MSEPTASVDLIDAYEQLRRLGAWPERAVRRIRDLLIASCGPLELVIACDSNAATGDKPSDYLQQDPALTGYSAAKVPLMEVIAAGATPLILVDNLCCELEPTGRGLLLGIQQALNQTVSGVTITGSDETNMPTVQTGIGVTVIGVALGGALRIGRSKADDLIVCLGVPKDGISVPYQEGDPDIANITDITAISKTGLADELLPVGSRGVAFEAGQLALTNGLALELDDPSSVDHDRSAGASTCFLATVPTVDLEGLRKATRLPISMVGRLRQAQ